MRRGFAFTLVELLVVITITVVLLSLLVPAMNQAVYQAELAVCGANNSALAAQVLQYAFENKRRYPARLGLEAKTAAVFGADTRPQLIARGLPGPGEFDERPVLRKVTDLNKTLNCPLLKPVDLETPDVTSWIYSSQQLWFGWQFSPGNVKQKGMFKVGDRFSAASPVDGTVREFSVLVSDWVSQDPNVVSPPTWSYGAHPDYHDKTMPEWHQDDGAPHTTLSFFRAIDGQVRGPIDRNVAFDDGSVRRYSGVKWDDYKTLTHGMAPMHEQRAGNLYITYLPLQ